MARKTPAKLLLSLTFLVLVESGIGFPGVCCCTCFLSGMALVWLLLVLLLYLYSGLETAKLWEELTLSLELLENVVVAPWLFASRKTFIWVSSIWRMVSFWWIILSFCRLRSSNLWIKALFWFSIIVSRKTNSESGTWHFFLVKLSPLSSLSLFLIRNRLLPNLLWSFFWSIFLVGLDHVWPVRTFIWTLLVCLLMSSFCICW